jgi:hypothetical protein
MWFNIPSACTRPDDYIFVACKINSSGKRGQRCERADHLLETHRYKRMLISPISIEAEGWYEPLLTGSLQTNEQRLFESLLGEVFVDLQDDSLIHAEAPPFLGRGFT